MVNFARANCVTEDDGDPAFDSLRGKLAETFYKNDPARTFCLLAGRG
jgi:hypothetical protein